MPRGFNPSTEEFSTKLHQWFIIHDAAGDVNECDPDPVHVAVVYDEQGYGPHGASLYVDQNRYHASPDSALQEAYEMEEAWMREHSADHLKELEEERLAEHVKDYMEEHPGAQPQEAIEAVQDEAYQEADEWFRERMDGMTWTMTAAEFVAAFDSWSAEDQARVLDTGNVRLTRREECEEDMEPLEVPDLPPRLSSTRRSGRQHSGPLLDTQTVVDLLVEAGAVYERREDSHGTTKTGWWMDGVYLGRTPQDARRALQGD